MLKHACMEGYVLILPVWQNRRLSSLCVCFLLSFLFRVRCTACGEESSRSNFHYRLEQSNGEFLRRIQGAASEVKPDGDADIDALVGDYGQVSK